MLSDAEMADETCSEDTYKHFTESYALQIWKAADGYEFFLNDRLVDFEGETLSYLGTEIKETGPQLILMTTEDQIHLVLPISPEVAVVFCNESRCWESPFAESMHRLKVPYPANSLLKNAPHRDIVNIHVPREKKGKKTYPATTAWRVSIGALSQHHHRIITSYSLSHAQSFVVVRSRRRFERAKRELEVFNMERVKMWKNRGMRFEWRDAQKQRREEVAGPTETQVTKIVDDHISALTEIHKIIKTTRESVPITKEMALNSWMAIRTLKLSTGIANSPTLEGKSSRDCFAQPALISAFEAAYPPKTQEHRDLVVIDFAEFFIYSLGEETFSRLLIMIEQKIWDLVSADTFDAHVENSKQILESSAASVSYQGCDDPGSQYAQEEKELLENPSFKSVVWAAESFEILKWMFEERQDILATFVQQIVVKPETMQRRINRIRARRV